MENPISKNWWLMLLFLCVLGCSQENILPPPENDDDETPQEIDLSPQPYIEQSASLCIPQSPIDIKDTSVFIQYCNGNRMHGTAVAFREDYIWEAPTVAGYRWHDKDKITISMQKYDCEFASVGKERLFFVVPTNYNNCIQLNAPSSREISSNSGYVRFRYGDGDVTYEKLFTKPDAYNRLEIIELDTINWKISGRFMLTVEHQGDEPFDSDYYGPSTFSFTNGYFSCDLIPSP